MKVGLLMSQAIALYLYTYYYSGLALGPLVSDAKAICEIKMEYGYVFICLKSNECRCIKTYLVA